MQEKIDNQVLTGVGRLIYERRRVCQFSQEDVAKKLGVPRGVVAKFETGQQEIFVDQLDALSRLLGSNLARFIPEPSTLGTANLRHIKSAALFPGQETLVGLLSRHFPQEKENYLPAREPNSKRKRSPKKR